MDAADRADDVIQGAVDRALENHARRPTGRQCTDGGVVICCDCEEPIDLRRLAAVPTATRCAGCQGVAER
ncbi:MAG: TraR/DksA family transcriptional regulator [Gammaproteobacteria bacterium]|nr:TraR/DksA family transcriptional regulator [Gammaproteobacteria bacterium]